MPPNISPWNFVRFRKEQNITVNVGCLHMLIYNARVWRRLRALWSYKELGLTNHSVFLNVAILLNSTMHAAYVTRVCSTSTYARNLSQLWSILLAAKSEKIFSRRQWALEVASTFESRSLRMTQFPDEIFHSRIAVFTSTWFSGNSFRLVNLTTLPSWVINIMKNFAPISV